ncbi:MAG: CDP-alcohol phosphatidyltransferase family protein, partial [Thermoanaerobaculia bacterium]
AGFARVAVVGAGERARAALSGTRAEFPASAPEGAIRLPWNTVAAVKDLEELRSGGACPGIAVRTEADLPRAERFLLRGLVKDTEGFMSKHFERKISLALSRRLVATSVTPNAMTLLSVGIGLLGAVFFLRPTAPSETAGALLFLLHSILDGCDGELARLKFQESRYGGLLDFWGDNVVHVAVFSAMAIGWSRMAGESWPLFLGALAVGGTLASALLVYSRTMAAPKQGPLFTSVAASGPSRLSRVADALSRRDFIYLVLILSLLGKARWFLVLAAAGAPVYFLALTAIALAERRRPRSA